MKYAVCVTFVVEDEHIHQFSELILDNAKVSLEKEPGCLQFDVCSDQENPNEVFLYEIYSSIEAFDDHLNSEHFKSFDAAVSSMIKDKHVKTYRTVT